MIASEGPAVDSETANAAPIVTAPSDSGLPKLNFEPVPDLPPELQPDPGDVLLGKAFWPWEDLGAQSIPEQWLYMSRKVQGVIAQLAVQTPAGPKLVNADQFGNIGQVIPYKFLTDIPVPIGGTGQWVGAIPFGSQGIVISLANWFNISEIVIVDNATAETYHDIHNPQVGTSNELWFALPESQTKQWLISITAKAGTGPWIAHVNAFRAGNAVSVFNQPSQPVFVQTPSGSPARITVSRPDGTQDFNIESDGSGAVDLHKFGGTLVSLGQKTGANSLPIVPASDWLADVSDRAGRILGIIGQDSDTVLDTGGEQDILALASRTVNTFVGPLRNKTHRGLLVLVHVTVAGTGSIRFFMQAQYAGASTNVNLLEDTTNVITAAGEYSFMVYPDSVPANPSVKINATYQFAVPDNFIIGILKSDASAWTYSAALYLLK